MSITIQNVLVIITLLIASWVLIRDFFQLKETNRYIIANKDLGY